MSPMQLSNKQKNFNDDPLYWKWFQEWWDKDYSFENLKNHVTPDGQVLSDVYNDNVEHFICNFDGKNWHPINSPPHDPDGNLNNLKANNRYFQHSKRTLELPYLVGFVRNDWRPAKKKELKDCHFPHGIANNHAPEKSSDCMWSRNTGNNYDLTGNHKGLYLLSRPREFGNLNLVNCVIGEVGSLGKARSSIQLKNCILPEGIILKGDKITLDKPKVRDLTIVVERESNISFVGRKTHRQNVKVKSSDGNLKTVFFNLNETDKTSISVSKLTIKNQYFDNSDLSDLEIFECNLLSELCLARKKIGSVSFFNSSFRQGLNISDSEISDSFIMSGVTCSKVSNFRNSIFQSSAEFSDYLLEDSSSRNTVLQNPDFRDAEFYDNFENHDDLEYACAANFNDANFVGTTRFEGALFAGVPKFHGTIIHSETSFDGFRVPPEYAHLNKLSEERLQDYQSAFRCLRQHMENISNFSQAAQFGVLEMKAKQNRKNVNVVPKSVAFATRLYGKFADYGQSFIKPLLCLGIVWLASVFFQVLLFAGFESDCNIFENGCAVDFDVATEAVKRGSSFGVPPVTLLIKRSIEQNVNVTEWSITLQIFSGFLMLIHALVASFMVFLIGLALKRRLQMR